MFADTMFPDLSARGVGAEPLLSPCTLRYCLLLTSSNTAWRTSTSCKLGTKNSVYHEGALGVSEHFLMLMSVACSFHLVLGTYGIAALPTAYCVVGSRHPETSHSSSVWKWVASDTVYITHCSIH
jgi:hypothetical protein